MYAVYCEHCQKECGESPLQVECQECRNALFFRYSKTNFRPDASHDSMWRYRHLLPVCEESKIVSLHEGNTPLQRSRSCDGFEIFFKNETLNPTGSHKDRFLSVGLTKALEFGHKTVMLYSDGSTALSSAAYAAQAGLKSITVVPRGTPDFRLLPLMIYGSPVIEYLGPPAEALDWVHQMSRSLGIYETCTYRRANPYESEGPKTIGFEIFEQLGRPPDWIVVPVGGGATLAAIWRAFSELRSRGLVSKLPRMVAALPAGCDVLGIGLARKIQSEQELMALAPREVPPTIQNKIAMRWPLDGVEAITAMLDTGGLVIQCSDAEALDAQQRLGAKEGIYAEPSSAVALAASRKLLQMQKVSQGESLVAVITGSGFRETGALSDCVTVRRTQVDPAAGASLLEKFLMS